ncbi:MAG: metalloregulator ArsR/SmtB family transcription factor, partial [Geminicoccaceae bacterium]
MTSDARVAINGLDSLSVREMIECSAQASRFLKVMANGHRLVILCSLATGERSVGELEEILDVRQPNLSQQLARLREEGLVS